MFKPLSDLVLVQPIQEQKIGSIHIPASAAMETRAKVIAVGPGRQLESGTTSMMTVKVGDVVAYPFGVGTEITLHGEKYRILSELDLFGILQD